MLKAIRAAVVAATWCIIAAGCTGQSAPSSVVTDSLGAVEPSPNRVESEVATATTAQATSTPVPIVQPTPLPTVSRTPAGTPNEANWPVATAQFGGEAVEVLVWQTQTSRACVHDTFAGSNFIGAYGQVLVEDAAGAISHQLLCGQLVADVDACPFRVPTPDGDVFMEEFVLDPPVVQIADYGQYDGSEISFLGAICRRIDTPVSEPDLSQPGPENIFELSWEHALGTPLDYLEQEPQCDNSPGPRAISHGGQLVCAVPYRGDWPVCTGPFAFPQDTDFCLIVDDGEAHTCWDSAAPVADAHGRLMCLIPLEPACPDGTTLVDGSACRTVGYQLITDEASCAALDEESDVRIDWHGSACGQPRVPVQDGGRCPPGMFALSAITCGTRALEQQ